jgi:predicted lipoprotein
MRSLKTILFVVTIGIIAYNSVYFRKLDEYRASKAGKDFDPAAYARKFWETRLTPKLDSAVDLTQLISQLSTDPATAFARHSHALGIGNLRYFLVKGTGTVESVGTDDVTLVGKNKIRIATELIFGNAVRDASGQININEFVNTMDFNNVSAEINRIIRETVLPPFRKAVRNGSTVSFTGAIELNKEHLKLEDIELVPIRLNIIDAEN